MDLEWWHPASKELMGRRPVNLEGKCVSFYSKNKDWWVGENRVNSFTDWECLTGTLTNTLRKWSLGRCRAFYSLWDLFVWKHFLLMKPALWSSSRFWEPGIFKECLYRLQKERMSKRLRNLNYRVALLSVWNVQEKFMCIDFLLLYPLLGS